MRVILMNAGRQYKILIPKDPESLVLNKVKVGGTIEPVYGPVSDLCSMAAIGSYEAMAFFGRPSDIYHDYYDPLEYCRSKTNAISQLITTVFRTIIPESKLRPIGEVTAYYHKANAAVVKLFDRISLGETILIEGKNTSIIQEVTSLEINNKK